VEPVNEPFGGFDPAGGVSRLSHALDMRPAGPMTGFTSRTVLRPGHCRSCVHGLGELPRLVGVARATRLRSHVVFRPSFRGPSPGN
jgi:hypothetical protein